ncbi:LysM peptidoglycan-binding domain-containing protein [Bacillus sp. REN3]|uniref:cell division suppressor protein YneA n=1 Tax=Bacillus sp. REN3 TaxID=2802440 RepID=UPI001AED66D6|nr:LysM peptidoglycan-binding domain-containing protein [Bacillus sp. REN3]
MKKLWNHYSYAIVLIAVSLIFSLVAKVHLNSSDDSYITVTIEEGQSLWEIADIFSEEHNLSESEFVRWVQKENGIMDEKIYPGDELVIPVNAEREEISQIADSGR